MRRRNQSHSCIRRFPESRVECALLQFVVQNQIKKELNMDESRGGLCVPEDPGRLSVLTPDRGEVAVNVILESLKQDLVVLVKDVSPSDADRVMHNLADKLGLGESLKL